MRWKNCEKCANFGMFDLFCSFFPLVLFVFRVVSAITCYFGYIKLMYMMRFNKKMSSFACVLKVAANDITNFLIMFTVCIISSNNFYTTIVFCFVLIFR